MPRDITQNIILKTTLQDGISKSVKQAARSSTTASARIDKNVRKNISGFKRLTASVRGFRNTLATIKAAVPGLAAIAAVVGGGMGFLAAARSAAEFGTAMAEVSTLVDTSVVNMGMLREGVLGISSAMGAAPTTVAKGLYQTISSGAVDAADSISLLSQAQELAVAGVATTAQAVDLLTTSLNAYGFSIDEAARVSDVMFETVKQGKTTIPELAQNIGRAIPLAAQLGVAIEEIGAATAAMTKGGIATDSAIVALRGTMAALISPTTEAVSILGDAGIDISKTRIEAEGLVAVLGDLERAFGDQPAVLAAIVPNIRALTGLFALTGKQADEFRRILDELENSSGAMGEAFQKQMEDPAFRAKVNIQALKNAFLAMGVAIINSFNEMINRAGGIEKVTDSLEAAGKAIGAVFGVVTNNIGRLLGDVNRLMDAMGGAEEFGNLVASLITAVGELATVIVEQSADLLITTFEKFTAIVRKVASTLDSVTPGDTFRSLSISAEEAQHNVDLVTDELLRMGVIQAELQAKFDSADVWTDAWRIADKELLEYNTSIRKVTGRLEDMQAIAAGADQFDLDTLFGRTGERTARALDSVNAITKAIDKFRSAREDAAIPLPPVVFEWPSELLGDKAIPISLPDDVFVELTSDGFALEKQLHEITLALEGNKQAILDYEIAQLRVAASTATGNKDQIAALNSQIDSIEALKQARIDESRLSGNAEFANAWNDVILRNIEMLRDQRDEEQSLANLRAELARDGERVLDSLNLANARTFEGRLEYERKILKAERDRQIEQIRGAKNFEELSQRIRDAYGIQLDGLRPEALTGFTGLVRGAHEALEEFVIFVKDDAAFAFSAMTSALGSFSQGFGRAFVEFASGAKSASAAFTAFAQNFIAQIAQMFAQRAAAQFLGLLIGSFAAAASTRTAATSPSGISHNILAMGGTVRGGLSDLRAYAGGGPIVRKPHIALVGEGQYNEAVVPLPDGRSIPVDMRGSESSARNAGTEILVSPTINFSVQSLDPRGTVEVLLDPEVQKSLRAAITDSLVSGSDAAFSSAVKGA